MARASRPAYVVWSYRVPEGSKGGVGEAMELGVRTCAQGQDGARRRGSLSLHLHQICMHIKGSSASAAPSAAVINPSSSSARACARARALEECVALLLPPPSTAVITGDLGSAGMISRARTG